jgi:glycosyltransferase involved in cell wall biosynthesis
VRVITEARCRRVVRYHNVTPAHFYDILSPKYADYCRTGRAQMRELARAGCDLYLSDSPFNQQELLAAGAPAERCRVVPPFHQVDRLVNVEPDPEVLRDYGDGRTNFLFVGRRVPNKGHRILLDAFAAYRRHHDPDSRLLLIGKGDAALAAYTAALRAQVRRLGLQGHVVFLEGVTEGELRAFYERASAFLVASEHEGFCVPLVEAMALGVPVVAYATTAVPDTLGEAGLAWPEPDPYLLAQSAARVAKDGGLRRRLAEAGRRRYRDCFATAHLERAFADALRPLLHAPLSACG